MISKANPKNRFFLLFFILRKSGGIGSGGVLAFYNLFNSISVI